MLYGRGEPVAVSEGGVVSYFGTDITGSVRSVTDGNGAVESEYSYDAFGSPYLGSLESGLSFGYCGKVFDCGTGLYDYGFRDYSPASGRFTTVDPIRDGSNWFSYVVNDPVNFRDPWGLSATDTSWWSKAKDTVKGWGESIKSDLSQTWNEIKDVASTAFTNTQTAVSNFISSTQSNFSKWGEQAKADFEATENQIKDKVKTYIKSGINKVTKTRLINNTDDVFFAFPENDFEEIVTNPKIGYVSGSNVSEYNIDGGIEPESGAGFKISDGYSVTVTKDENGNYHYEPQNVVPKNHPILRAVAAASYNLKIYNSYEDWKGSSEAGWLDKEYVQKALEK